MKMSKMMQAAVVESLEKPLVLQEVPVPEPGRGEILVRIEATGVCHTDLHAAKGDWPVKPKPPFIPGHEGVGHVAALGPGVRGVKEGDRVGVPWLHTACGACVYCRSGARSCRSSATAIPDPRGSLALPAPRDRGAASGPWRLFSCVTLPVAESARKTRPAPIPSGPARTCSAQPRSLSRPPRSPHNPRRTLLPLQPDDGPVHRETGPPPKTAL